MIHVVVLAYNEAKSLPELLRRLARALGRADKAHRILIVDDGSTDQTPEVVERLSKSYPLVHLRHSKNQGVARAFDTGLRRAASDAAPDDMVVTLEGDSSNDPDTLPALAAKFAEGHDVVCASRYAPGGAYVGFPLKRRILSLGANWVARLFFHIPGIRDYTLFYRGYRASALRRAIDAYGADFIEGRGFSSNAEILVKVARAGATRFAEVPTVYRYDLKPGASTMRVGKNLAEYFRLFWRSLCGKRR